MYPNYVCRLQIMSYRAGNEHWIIRISLYSSATKNLLMDARLLDVIIGVIAFLILVALLAILPMVITSGIAYLAAIIIFILVLSGAGYIVNEKIA
ncbi:MAG: hypothetical protein CVV34_04265 [Methanomicrobiales archaeon HGW-Methanomicrobiales-5]|nr:MAG: hypothetical protein CVV34_04265 [Methanomicrobiales archaeon HGW-Methanomicrobiales-5]